MRSVEYTRRYLEQAYSIPYNCCKLVFLLILETQPPVMRLVYSVALELPVVVAFFSSVAFVQMLLSWTPGNSACSLLVSANVSHKCEH